MNPTSEQHVSTDYSPNTLDVKSSPVFRPGIIIVDQITQTKLSSYTYKSIFFHISVILLCAPSGLRRGGSTATSARWWCPSILTVPWTSTAATPSSSTRAASCTRGRPTSSPSPTLLTKPWRGGTKTRVSSSQVSREAPLSPSPARPGHEAQRWFTVLYCYKFSEEFLSYWKNKQKSRCDSLLFPLILRCFLFKRSSREVLENRHFCKTAVK